ncbi:MAG: molybdenum cofactor guanylyltransferase [Anaerolineae bacterium]|nr:molybdenum cofactor guanylyltransferase [Anaerolineae bacterium]
MQQSVDHDGTAAQTPLAIAVLAGGLSSRMGYNKSFALLNGDYMITHTLRALDAVRGADAAIPLFIVANDAKAYQQFGRPIVGDVLPGRSSLNGLYSALWHSPGRYTLCVACDMPFLKPALLSHLIEAAQDVQAVVPRIDGQLEALCAVYEKSCMQPFYAALQAGVLKIQNVLASLRLRTPDAEELRPFDPDLTSFVNVNTPDEIARFNTKPHST